MRAPLAAAVLLLAACARQADAPATKLEVGVAPSEGPAIPALTVAPLETVRLHAADSPSGATWHVTDGAGREYATVAAGDWAAVTARGVLGRHQARLLARDGAELARTAFTVDARTRFDDGSGRMRRWSEWLASEIASGARDWYIDGRRMRRYVGWLRDDTHVLLATRFWEPDIEDVARVFIDHQRPDGMIWDLIDDADERDPHGDRWLAHCSRLDLWGAQWAGLSEDGRWRFERIPVEADVEYLLVENVRRAWQASGDDVWMARALPACERAMAYVMSSPLRWSAEHGLVKRGYTIDTWDFQHEDALAASPTHGRDPSGNPDKMWIDAGTPMCLMNGDQTGMYDACRDLAHDACASRPRH